MIRGIEIRVYPNKEQTEYISRLLGCCRYVYNHLLDFQDSLFEKEKRGAKFSEVTAFFNKEKAECPFLREVHSKVLQQARIDLQTAWGNYFRTIGMKSGVIWEKPTHHKRGKKDSCRFPVDAFIGIKGNRISLIKQLKDMHFKCSRRDERYLNKHQQEVRSVTMRRTGSGRIYCSVLIEDYRIQPLPPIEKDVGIDLGVKDCAITSDGVKYGNPKALYRFEKKIAKWERIKSRRVKGSHRRRKAIAKISRLQEKVANIRKDSQHKATTELIRNNQTIYTEDLNVSGMKRNHKLAKAVSDSIMGSFVRMIEYKSVWYGREHIKIGRFYASSQICSKCGYKNQLVKDLSVRKWECPECHTIHDRDVNAAVNVLHEGRKKKASKVGSSSPELNARGQGNGGALESVCSKVVVL